MGLLRHRPLVFVSSTIEELRVPRAEIEEAIRELGLVDEWLFEFHAVSIGAPSEVQYLSVARNCDLLVLIIGQEMSDATRAEYDEGFADNPHKILPFYVGEPNDAVRDFRSLVDSRHSRTQVDVTDELPAVAADSVKEAVLTGRLVVPALRQSVSERLGYLDALVGLDPPLSFVPYCGLNRSGFHAGCLV